MYLIHLCLNSMGREYWMFGDSVLILKTQAEGLVSPGQKLLLSVSRLGGSLKVDLTSWKFEILWYLLKRCDVEEMKKENRDVQEWYSRLIRLAEGK